MSRIIYVLSVTAITASITLLAQEIPTTPSPSETNATQPKTETSDEGIKNAHIIPQKIYRFLTGFFEDVTEFATENHIFEKK